MYQSVTTNLPCLGRDESSAPGRLGDAGAADALPGVRDGLKPGLGDLLAARLAPAERASANPPEGRGHLAQQVRLVGDQTLLDLVPLAVRLALRRPENASEDIRFVGAHLFALVVDQVPLQLGGQG